MTRKRSSTFIAGFICGRCEEKLLQNYSYPNFEDFPDKGVTYKFIVPRYYFVDNADSNAILRLKLDDVFKYIEQEPPINQKSMFKIRCSWSYGLTPNHIEMQCMITAVEPPVKKMTISEIQKKLGHRVEIISEE